MHSLNSADIADALKRPSPKHVEIATGILAMRAFSVAEAAAIVQEANASPHWIPAHINANGEVNPAVRDAELLVERHNAQLTQRYRQRLEIIVGELAHARAPGSALAEGSLVRYAPGGKYIDHRDATEDGVMPRALSLVCYLNEDFAGGETAFIDEQVGVPPMTGIVIAFAPQLLHRAEPVTSGRKFVITAWYHRR
jgi:predicted 2-oxoglutarate/Fe(II)-dependent dioxygenase YbiX